MTQQTKFYLENHPHVALNDLLKMVGIADTGGRAKLMVAEGNISVNGTIELRKTAKIQEGSIVTGAGFEILVCEGYDA
ncbi:RNA-binding S4 domain-containing protein [Wohlfahrtiimonas chitiniclastica]|uniref:RNA-binding S4 domain-containing protein n=1 Tax=Wohlfahrtiimonas chitiniclastica TaxID=400946 RepID=UPI001BD00BF4|nr:RNA-binding S4 domain-containing protein [Wohlfahrtiimonas chitiniclastica]MBS7815151.1 RNA-binding S4 domain-containing protein [Wohlfahrtiimonas chitiniclastica]